MMIMRIINVLTSVFAEVCGLRWYVDH